MSTTNTSPASPGGLELKVQDALSGVQSVLAAKSTLQLNGKPMTQAQIAAQLTGFVNTIDAVTTAKQSYAEALATRKTAEPVMREFLVQLRGALIGLFGRGSPQFAKFGMTATKPAKLKPTVAVLSAAQSQLTRAQRGTMSKKQRQSITVISPPQVTLGVSGRLAVTPPSVNVPSGSSAPSSAVASGAASSSGASSSPASGQVSATVQPAPAVAQPAAVAAQPAIVSPIAAPLSK